MDGWRRELNGRKIVRACRRAGKPVVVAQTPVRVDNFATRLQTY